MTELADADTMLGLAAPHGLDPLDAVLLVPGHGPGKPAVIKTSAVTASGIALRSGFDFVVHGSAGTMRVLPLRSLLRESTTIHFAEGTVLQHDRAASLPRQTIRWGLPW